MLLRVCVNVSVFACARVLVHLSALLCPPTPWLLPRRVSNANSGELVGRQQKASLSLGDSDPSKWARRAGGPKSRARYPGSIRIERGTLCPPSIRMERGAIT